MTISLIVEATVINMYPPQRVKIILPVWLKPVDIITPTEIKIFHNPKITISNDKPNASIYDRTGNTPPTPAPINDNTTDNTTDKPPTPPVDTSLSDKPPVSNLVSKNTTVLYTLYYYKGSSKLSVPFDTITNALQYKALYVKGAYELHDISNNIIMTGIN